MITEVVKNKECCGCSLCAAVCLVNAIEITHGDGFEFPQVNQDKCIGCSKCIHVCPVHNSENIKQSCNEPQIMIASNKSIEEKRRSTSGGVFIELASTVIRAGGGCIRR